MGDIAIEIYNEACNYYSGDDGYPLDYEKAFELFSKAAGYGVGDAMNMLGVMYEEGDGVDEDIEQAFSWYIKAAQAGDALGLYNVGRFYFNGICVKKDVQKAYMYFEESLNVEENVLAAEVLGYHYMETKRYDEAAELLAYVADETESPEAYFALGALISEGKIEMEDSSGDRMQDACEYYLRAAELGSAEAMDEYGRILWVYGDEDGGVKQEGYKWIKRAADEGYEPAKKRLRNIQSADLFNAIRNTVDRYGR